MLAGREVRAGTLLVGAAIAAMLATAPLLGDYTLFVLALVVINVIAVLSLNLLMGYAGQVSLGQAALVGIGAYAAADLARWGLPFPLPVLGAVMVGAGAATIVGLPSLRIRGLQVAATTLAIGLVAENLLFPRPWDSGAGTGIVIARPAFLVDGRAFLLLAIACLVLILLLDRAIRTSKIGRAFTAVRDRDDTAAARGVPVGRTKLLAYALSGVYAGMAGGLFAYLLEVVTPDSFTVFVSLSYVAAVVVGGSGSWAGVVVAAAAFAALPELLRPARTYAPLAGAILLAAVPLLRPEGLGWLLDRAVLGDRSGRQSHRQTRRWPRRRPQRRESQPRPARPAAHPSPHNGREIAPPRRPLALEVPMPTVLRTANVAVRFGGLQALDGVTMEVRRGEIVGLIGPNGAGKSTFFNCLSGFVAPTAGSISYRDRDLLALPPEARPALGIARTFQQVGLSPAQTVRENVLAAQHFMARYSIPAALVRAPTAVSGERELARRAAAALELVGIAHLADERVGDLPHGSQRLAEVTAALAMGPELLLLDEPFAGLGHEESDLLAHRLVALQTELGFAAVVIEHDVPLVARLCDYVYVLDQGRVLTEGTPDQVQRDPQVAAIYLGEPVATAQEVLAGV